MLLGTFLWKSYHLIHTFPRGNHQNQDLPDFRIFRIGYSYPLDNCNPVNPQIPKILILTNPP